MMLAKSPLARRLARLRGALAQGGFDAVLSDSATDIFSFTGCPDVGGHLRIHLRDAAYLPPSGPDAPPARAQSSGVEVEAVWPGEHALEQLAARLRATGVRRLASTIVAASLFAVPDRTKSALEIEHTPSLASSLRRIKEPAELELIRQAARIVEVGMAAVRDALRPGVREIDVAAEAEYVMRRMGQDGRVFETKIESGW